MGEFPDPVPTRASEVVVDVLAAGLHPRVRSSADGTHYTSEGALPLVPGIDGVGRTAEGELLYFVAHDETVGTFAERAVVDRWRAVVLPAGTDPVPGNAGRAAVHVSRLLEAAHVVAAGRPGPGREVLVVGSPEFATAGAEASIPSAFLRAADVSLQGSGQGSLSARRSVEELPALVAEIVAGRLPADAVALPMSSVEEIWGTAGSTGSRTVLTTDLAATGRG